jgi:hypothetical protein
MPLHDLVEYFNDRFGQEHRSSYRPFILKDNQVSGLFGPIRIESSFSPIRQTFNPTAIIGHTAKIEVSTYTTPYLYDDEIENLLANTEKQATDLESIINFDRLSRTVHMLNFLPLVPAHGFLFLEVDPRHILGIKQDHGVYFGEVISRCGLSSQHVVIVLSVYGQYKRYYQALMDGLDNYRHQGYQIALRFDNVTQNETALKLIASLSPDFVCVTIKNLPLSNKKFLDYLNDLTTVVTSVNGQSILQKIDQKSTDLIARKTSFDLVEGGYYRSIAFDYHSKIEMDEPILKANRF